MAVMNFDEESQRMMQQAATTPMLTKREERDLIAAMKGNGADAARAKAKLILAHQRLVISHARAFAWCGKPLSDLIQEGNIGILNAARKFDASHGTRFSTFAVFDIRERIRMTALDRGQAMYIPPAAVKKISKIKKLDVGNGGDQPTGDIDRAALLGMKVKEFRRLRDAGQSATSLNAHIGEDGSTEIGDLIADTRIVLPDTLIADRQLRELLEAALQALPERDREIVAARFAFDRDEEETLEDLSQRHGVTRERVRQIQVRALAKIAQGKYAKQLRSFLTA